VSRAIDRAVTQKRVLRHHCGQGQLAALRHAGLHGPADGDHEADHVVARQIDDLGHLQRVEAEHRAGVVAHRPGREHDRLPGDATRPHRFVPLQLLFSFVERSRPARDLVPDLGRSVPPQYGGAVDMLSVQRA
jgi:hypothetical protein